MLNLKEIEIKLRNPYTTSPEELYAIAESLLKHLKERPTRSKRKVKFEGLGWCEFQPNMTIEEWIYLIFGDKVT